MVTADALFAVEGFGPVSMAQIASGAHVTDAVLRAAFPSKRTLLLAALGNHHREWMSGLITTEETMDDPRDRVLAVFSHLEQRFSDGSYRGCAFVNGYGELGRQDPAVRDLADEHLRQVEQHIAMLCHLAVLPTHLAPALTLLLQGATREPVRVRESRDCAPGRAGVYGTCHGTAGRRVAGPHRASRLTRCAFTRP